MPSQTSPSDQRTAKDFLRRIREVSKLVVGAKLGYVWTGGNVLIVGHRVKPGSRRGRPARLSNGMYLNVELTLRVNRVSEKERSLLETTRATYTYQAGDDVEDPKPVFEYQYDRDASSPYPRCHLHVRAAPEHYRGKSFRRLHLPTRRVTLEQIVWHLIHEHGVQPRSQDWRDVPWRNEEWFRDIQENKQWPYDRPFDPPADRHGTA